jgi:hypothetical protein
MTVLPAGITLNQWELDRLNHIYQGLFLLDNATCVIAVDKPTTCFIAVDLKKKA